MSELSKRFNIAVVGRDTVGKSKVIDALLRIQSKKMDSKMIVETPEEEARNYTIYNRVYHLEHDNFAVNFIDTPGNTNFIPKVNTSLYIANGCIFVVSGTGISSGSLRVWESIVNNEKPRVIFMNMLDLPEANFENSLHAIEQSFSIRPAVLNIPWYDDGELVGVIDVIRKKLIRGTTGKTKEEELPETAVDDVDIYRETTIENLAEVDDELMELYLEGEEISEELLLKALEQGVKSMQVTPVMVGTGKGNIGISQLESFIMTNFPNHAAGASWLGKEDKSGDDFVERPPKKDEPFSGIVFKTQHDRYSGKMSFILVVSGTLKKGDKLINTSNETKFQAGRINRISGNDISETPEAVAGDIIILEKMDKLNTNETIADSKSPIFYDPIPAMQPRCTFKLEIPENAKEDRVLVALQKVLSEDPALRMHKNDETNELLLSGMGIIHLDVVKEHLKNVYDVEINLTTPHIAYHETISKPIEAEGKYKKQSGGHGQFGIARIKLEPLPRNSGFEFVNKIVGGVIPRQYIPAVEKGVVEALKTGSLGKYPVVDVRVTLYDGAFHDVDSSEFSFQQAGVLAIKKALPEAGPVLLEPLMEMEIDIPEYDMGKISKDIASRRGRVQGYDSKEFTSVITAEVPLSELKDYTPALREMTKGLGMFTMETKTYEVLTTHLAAKVLAERKTVLENM